VPEIQIALTKKLATAMAIKPETADESVNPIFCWTANWTNTFDGRKEDMVVMVNHATRFTVTIYGVKRNQFKYIEAKIIDAIEKTLLAMNLSRELVNDYLKQAGSITFTSNHDRKMTAQVNRQGLDAAFVVGRAVNERGGRLKFENTLGRTVSRRPVNYSNSHDTAFFPADKMIGALSKLTGKPTYKYRAFELLVTLNLEIYNATRRLIVCADMDFQRLHEVLQEVFNWKNYHLFDFAVYDNKAGEPCAYLVPNEESLLYYDNAVLLNGCKLSEYLSMQSRIAYTYDMSANWTHEIKLVRIIDEYRNDSPYLLEASGQTPPEDVGGIGGFIAFREIMLNPNHPEFADAKQWCGHWSPELREWNTRPRFIY